MLVLFGKRARKRRSFRFCLFVVGRKDGFQRRFCSSLDEAEAKVEAEMRWLSRHRHTLIEAFIIDVQDITVKIKNKK